MYYHILQQTRSSRSPATLYGPDIYQHSCQGSNLNSQNWSILWPWPAVMEGWRWKWSACCTSMIHMEELCTWADIHVFIAHYLLHRRRSEHKLLPVSSCDGRTEGRTRWLLYGRPSGHNDSYGRIVYLSRHTCIHFICYIASFTASFFFLHPHLNSSWHAFESSGSVVQQGLHGELSVLSQPHAAGEGRVGSPCRHWPHMWPAWYTARFTCWTSAPVVRGMFSILRFPETNILFLASNTLLREDVRWYNRPTHLSFMSSGDTWLGASGDTCLGYFDNLWKTCFRWSYYAHQMNQAVFFPSPWKAETVSHPDTVCKNMMIQHLTEMQ